MKLLSPAAMAATLIMLALSVALAACRKDENPARPYETLQPQTPHGLALTAEENQSFSGRQEQLDVARKAFLEASAALDNLAPVAGAGAGTELDAQVATAKARAQKALADWHGLIKPIRAANIGYAWEGRHGELLYCRGNGDGAAHIVRQGDTLEILKPDAYGVPRFIGLVRRTGEYIRIGRFRPEAPSIENAPFFWGAKNAYGEPDALSERSPIACADPGRPTRPDGALGWLFPTREGHFICVPKDCPPIANVVWVVAEGRGFRLVHSGPEYTGDYAVIDGNGMITFHTPFKEFASEDWSGATWNIYDQKRTWRTIYKQRDGIAFDADALAWELLPAGLERSRKTWIGPDGAISIEADPAID